MPLSTHWKRLAAFTLMLPLAVAHAGPHRGHREDEPRNRRSPPIPCVTAPDQEGQRTCFITSKLQGLVADIQGENREMGATVIAYPAKSWKQGNDNQQWELVPAGDGYYIRSRLNGLVLDIQGANTAAATPVITWEPNGGDNQIWYLVPSPLRGYFFIQSKLNGFVLDIEGARTDGQGRLIAYPMKNADSDNQLWMID